MISIKKSDYETLLAQYSTRTGADRFTEAISPLLRSTSQYSPTRTKSDYNSFTVVRIRQPEAIASNPLQRKTPRIATSLPCDLAILMCDPEWKIKMGMEIIVFIHRPEEDFSDLIDRWRKTQVDLDRDYEWLMPPNEQHMISEAAEEINPLFVVFEGTSDRIKQGLAGAGFPYIVQCLNSIEKEAEAAGSQLD